VHSDVPHVPYIRRDVGRRAFKREVVQVDVWKRVCFDDAPLLAIRIILRDGNNEVEADDANTELERGAFDPSISRVVPP
jgi:hypothetical protein